MTVQWAEQAAGELHGGAFARFELQALRVGRVAPEANASAVAAALAAAALEEEKEEIKEKLEPRASLPSKRFCT